MSDKSHDPVTANHWDALRRFTDARIGLGRAGTSLPTKAMLAFQLDHARARDAVHFPLSVDSLLAELTEGDQAVLTELPLVLQSQAQDRMTYLQRPDLGRRLCEASRARLTEQAGSEGSRPDLAIVIADGLSSTAVQQHAPPFLRCLLQDLHSDARPWQLAPISIVEQGRVAIGDDIGAALNAQAVVVIIGERPGLSSPDSLGLYLTYQPKTGLNDANRNCVSNVRPAGLSFGEASQRLLYLLRESHRLKLSGVGLKDRTQDITLEGQADSSNFLVTGHPGDDESSRG